MPDVLLEVNAETGVALITLNRPEARNAMSANVSSDSPIEAIFHPP